MDTIFHNGNIITMDKAIPKAQAVAVKNGIIVRVGSDNDILALAKPGTKLVDLGGRLMLPGFCDSHLHLLSYGYSLEKIPLGGCKSKDELVALGKKFMEEHPHLSWIQGRGWNNDAWQDNSFPTRHDLDKISAKIPITVTRTCGHIICANTPALKAMGITRDTPQVPGGVIEMDEHGEPLGIFCEEARSIVYSAIPALTVEDMKRMLVNGGKQALKYGITSMQSDDFEAITPKEDELLMEAYQSLAQSRQLPIRVYQQCLLPPISRVKAFIGKGYKTGVGDDLFKIGPLKLLCDGSLGARTALMSQPYADDQSTSGVAVYDQNALDELVATAHNAGMTVAAHAIGDGCIDMCLNAIEKAVVANPMPDMRHSLIHCQITREDQLKRFRDLNVIAHIQPIFIDYDMHVAATRLGDKRIENCYAWRTMADTGVHYACGSDCPVEMFNVLEGIYCAVTSMDLKGYPGGQGWKPSQRLTVEQAVYGYTMGGAYAAYEDGIKGSITVGKLADMAVLEADIFAIEPAKIKDVKVDMTILGGQVVYSRA